MPRRKPTFWTLDAETDPFKHGRVPEPFLWGVYNGDDNIYETFRHTRELSSFLIELEHQRGPQLFYAHNGGKFDYHFLRQEFNADEPILVINGRMSKFRIGGHEFRDSLNIFPNTRLKDFGIKDEIDYRTMEASIRDSHMATIIAYNRQDCVGLWQVIKAYREKYGKNLTQAGASMKVWQKMSGEEAPRQSRSQYTHFKPFYYGGRVQCFEWGNCATEFQVYDINSAYPFAMLSNHPISVDSAATKKLPKKYSEIGPCLIRLRCRSLTGALPLRQDNDLYFPADETLREYCVTGYEFLAADELGTLKDIELLDVYRFNRVINFKNYIEHFFDERERARKAGDIAGRTFGKYFMNSLYGKFGANCEQYAEYVIATSDSLGRWTKKGYRHYKDWGERFLMERKPSIEELDDIQGKWRYYNICTAASVTGYVRAYLYRALHAASGVIYCDTDSIAARQFGEMPTGTALGAWKHEMTCDRYSISGKKTYAFHIAGREDDYDSHSDSPAWKVASKGVNLCNMPEGPAEIAKIAAGASYQFAPEAPTMTITRECPRFISRTIQRTAKDMTRIPLK